MKLWTVQPIDVYNQVMSADGYSMNLDHPGAWGGEYKEAYAWLRDKAVERGLVDNGRGMIWSWYRRGGGRRKPDVRTLRKTNSCGQELCCMTVEVPDDQVLLLNSEQWLLRMQDMACITAEEEAMDDDEFVKRMDELYALPEDEQRRYRESTWDLIFDTTGSTSVEAVFFGLDRSMVKCVQFFTGEYRESF